MQKHPDTIKSGRIDELSTEEQEQYELLQKIYLEKQVRTGADTELPNGMRTRRQVRPARIELRPDLKKKLEQLRKKEMHHERYRLLRLLSNFERKPFDFGGIVPLDLTPGLEKTNAIEVISNLDDDDDDNQADLVDVESPDEDKKMNAVALAMQPPSTFKKEVECKELSAVVSDKQQQSPQQKQTDDHEDSGGGFSSFAFDKTMPLNKSFDFTMKFAKQKGDIVKKTRHETKHMTIESIKELCPVKWNGSDEWYDFGGQTDHQEVILSLDVISDQETEEGYTLRSRKIKQSRARDDDPTQEYLCEKCMIYIDPDCMPNFAQPRVWINYWDDYEMDKNNTCYDYKAAKKELAESGSIPNVFDFIAGQEGDFYYHWEVDTQLKKKLSKAVATELMKRLFEGYLCINPRACENFGFTPLTPDGSWNMTEEKQKELKQSLESSELKKLVPYLVQISKYIEHSYWLGINELEESDDAMYVDTENWFFFQTSQKDSSGRDAETKFLLKFKWHHSLS